jgi:hypothetical protein
MAVITTTYSSLGARNGAYPLEEALPFRKCGHISICIYLEKIYINAKQKGLLDVMYRQLRYNIADKPTIQSVRVTLQLTVCLGVEPNLGLLTRDLTSLFFFFLS